MVTFWWDHIKLLLQFIIKHQNKTCIKTHMRPHTHTTKKRKEKKRKRKKKKEKKRKEKKKPKKTNSDIIKDITKRQRRLKWSFHHFKPFQAKSCSLKQIWEKKSFLLKINLQKNAKSCSLLKQICKHFKMSYAEGDELGKLRVPTVANNEPSSMDIDSFNWV